MIPDGVDPSLPMGQEILLATTFLCTAHADLERLLSEQAADNPAVSWEPFDAALPDAEVQFGDTGPEVRLTPPPEITVGDGTPEEQKAARWVAECLTMRQHQLRMLLELVAPVQTPLLRGQQTEPEPIDLEAIAADLGLHAETLERIAWTKRIRCPAGELPFTQLLGR